MEEERNNKEEKVADGERRKQLRGNKRQMEQERGARGRCRKKETCTSGSWNKREKQEGGTCGIWNKRETGRRNMWQME